MHLSNIVNFVSKLITCNEYVQHLIRRILFNPPPITTILARGRMQQQALQQPSGTCNVTADNMNKRWKGINVRCNQ